jgi:hypothetical protein
MQILGRMCEMSKSSPRGTVSEIQSRLAKIDERTRSHTACAIAVEFDFPEWISTNVRA